MPRKRITLQTRLYVLSSMLRYALGLCLLARGFAHLGSGYAGLAHSGLTLLTSVGALSASWGALSSILAVGAGGLLMLGLKVRAACAAALPLIADEAGRSMLAGIPLRYDGILMAITGLLPLVYLSAPKALEWYHAGAMSPPPGEARRIKPGL